MAQKACCTGFQWCCSSDCGFHKIWQCEFFCLELKCGSPGWAPNCGGSCFSCEKSFPQFFQLGICCNHCGCNDWCCKHWCNPLGMHCSEGQCLCCKGNCGIALTGFAELFCAQCKCCHCDMQGVQTENAPSASKFK